MRNIIKNFVLAGATATLMLGSQAAQAKIPEVKFHVVQGEFENLPTMEMKYQGGNWKWVNSGDSFNTRIKIYFKARGKVNFAHIHLVDTGASLWALPANYKTNKYEELRTVSIAKTILSPFQSKAAALCDVFGGQNKAVRDMSLSAEMQVSQSGDVVRKNGQLPVKVVCQPKPGDPARTPADLKVSQLKLYTVPARPVCGKPVVLITEIWTNKPGKVDFFLTRSDGKKQAASVKTQKVATGYVKRWSKTYTHEKSVNLKYQVVLANQPMTSNWADMKLNCGAGTDITKPGDLAN
jgi:hypothetical protein